MVGMGALPTAPPSPDCHKDQINAERYDEDVASNATRGKVARLLRHSVPRNDRGEGDSLISLGKMSWRDCHMNPDAIFPVEEKTVRRRRTLQA